MTPRWLPFIAVIALILPIPIPATAQAERADDEPIPTISVTGSAEVRAAPDEARVSLGIVAQKEAAKGAQNEANRIASAILEAIGQLDVPKEDVRTSRLTLTPVYESPKSRQHDPVPTEPRIIAYRASNVVTVRLSDLSKIGAVIDAGIGAGANQVQGVAFQLRQDETLRERALRQATAAARSKAAAIAETLGVELGPILEAEEGGVSIRYPQQHGLQMMTMEARAADTPVEPGEITVSGSVTLRYRIER